MKTIKTLLLSTIVFSSVFTINAQSVQSKVPTAICKYFFISQEQVYRNVGISDATNTAITLQKDDPQAREFLAATLKLILDSIKTNTGIQLLPIETLQNKVTYSRSGFPVGTLKKAAGNSDYQQFVTLEVRIFPGKTTTTTNSTSVGVNGQVNSKSIDGQETSTTVKYFPKVNVTLKFGDAEGKKLEKYKGEYTHDEKVTNQTDSRDLTIKGKNSSLTYSEIQNEDAEEIPYFFFLAKAVEDLISQLPKE